MKAFRISMVQDAFSTETRDVGTESILHAIKNGKWQGPIEQIRSIFASTLERTGDREAAKRAISPLKCKLPGILPSGRFADRHNKELIEHRGLLVADLDSLGDELERVRGKLLKSPYLWALFLSPSGDGLKAIFRVPADAAKRLGSFLAVERHVLELCGIQIDERGKDLARLCFVSYDPDLYYNPDAIEIEPLPEPEKPKAPPLNSESPPDLSLHERIATELVGALKLSAEKGGYFCKCPGEAYHDNKTGPKHTIVYLNSVPTLDCQHNSCAKIVEAFNHQLRSLIAKAECEQTRRTSNAKVSVQWQDPQPLPEDLPAVPPFDFQCLPETLRSWIEDISERMQCPPEFPAVAAMVALGSVIGRKIGVRPKRQDDWLEIANLWGCIIARPGLLKTPALQQALVPLRRLVAAALDQYEKKKRDYDVSAMLLAQSKKIVEETIKQHLKSKQPFDARKAAAREAAEKHLDEVATKPVCRRYEINDSTIEKLGELLAENPNGSLLFRDEISGFMRTLDREDHAGDRAKYLRCGMGRENSLMIASAAAR